MTRVAIVTASDSGIGKTTALMLAERGFDVGVTWHSDESGARETCREVEARGQRAEAIQLDLSTLPDCAKAIDTLIARFGRLDVLVNNAGAMTKAPFLEMPFDDWRRARAYPARAGWHRARLPQYLPPPRLAARRG